MLLLYLYKNLDYPLKYCKNLIIFFTAVITKDMSPEGVKQIIRVIKAIESEEKSRH